MPKGDPMRQVAASLSRVPADSVESITAQFVEIAERHGGRFTGKGRKRYQLTGYVARTAVQKDHVDMVVAGQPAGFWSIKTYGRGEVVPVRKHALSSGDRMFARAGPAAGNGAWERAIVELDHAVPDVVARVLGQADI